MHLFSVYQKAGGFASGIGIRYAPSSIVDNTHQAVSANLIVGERVLPHIFLRVANSEPIEVHDMLPADTRFKILVFAGDLSDHSDRAKLEALGEELNKPENFLRRYGRGDVGQWEVFDVMCFTSAKKDKIDLFGECLGPASPQRSHLDTVPIWSHRRPQVLLHTLDQVSTQTEPPPLNSGA